MTPELDKYASTVLAAYAVTLLLLALLVGLSWLRAARVKRALTQLDGRGPVDRHGRT